MFRRQTMNINHVPGSDPALLYARKAKFPHGFPLGIYNIHHENASNSRQTRRTSEISRSHNWDKLCTFHNTSRLQDAFRHHSVHLTRSPLSHSNFGLHLVQAPQPASTMFKSRREHAWAQADDSALGCTLPRASNTAECQARWKSMTTTTLMSRCGFQLWIFKYFSGRLQDKEGYSKLSIRPT